MDPAREILSFLSTPDKIIPKNCHAFDVTEAWHNSYNTMQNISKSEENTSISRSLDELKNLADTWHMPPCEGPRNPHWLGSALRWCQQNDLTIAEACILVEDGLTRPAQPGEMERMATKVYRTDVSALPRSTFLPPRGDGTLEELWREHPATPADVMSASPVAMSKRVDHPLDILGWLHPAEFLIYLAPRKEVTGESKTLAEWRNYQGDIASWSMCVPNRMSKRVGLNQDGKSSIRCRDTSCGFEGMKYAVAEPDFDADVPLVQAGVNPQHLSASVILHRIPRDRIVIVVDSGGKSLHAWLNVTVFSKSEREGFFQAGCVYGIDPAGRLPEQQFRLPNGTRHIPAGGGVGAVRQQVLYFNPSAL